MRNVFVVVSGAPGAGKTTLARQLAAALGLFLIEKDTIKEGLCDVLGAADVDASKRLGAATMEVMVALARINERAVLESTWIPELARDQLASLPGPVVEVLCDVPAEIAMERFTERAGTRHAVHFDHERLDAAVWHNRATPVDGGWPVIRVDTTREVDIAEVVKRIDQAL